MIDISKKFFIKMQIKLVGMCFFFSSRRRHTRLVSDWSSDVCSSDLRSPITSEFRGKLSRTLGQTVPLPDCGTLRLTGRMEHSSGEVLLMRRVSSRRKPKSTAVHKRAGRKAHKSAVVASIPRRRPVGSFYVVGLGASAGGLEALRSFFAAVPAKSGVAFVVIQHLAPTYRS